MIANSPMKKLDVSNPESISAGASGDTISRTRSSDVGIMHVADTKKSSVNAMKRIARCS